MIRARASVAPAEFDERCRVRGQRWLAENEGAPPEKFPDYWREFTPQLRAAFENRCAYLGMYITKGTVDHFVSKSRQRELAYDWSNYRYADFGVNSGKKPAWDGSLLDPFDVDDDWFEILLPSCQLRIIEARVPSALLDRVHFTVEKLKLAHGEEIVALRREWMNWFEAGEIGVEHLRRLSPLLARAVEQR